MSDEDEDKVNVSQILKEKEILFLSSNLRLIELELLHSFSNVLQEEVSICRRVCHVLVLLLLYFSAQSLRERERIVSLVLNVVVYAHLRKFFILRFPFHFLAVS